MMNTYTTPNSELQAVYNATTSILDKLIFNLTSNYKDLISKDFGGDDIVQQLKEAQEKIDQFNINSRLARDNIDNSIKELENNGKNLSKKEIVRIGHMTIGYMSLAVLLKIITNEEKKKNIAKINTLIKGLLANE